MSRRRGAGLVGPIVGLALAMSYFSPAFTADPPTGAIEIRVVGRAPLSNSNAYREALDDALRSAVQQVGGAEVVGVDVVENFFLERRTVLTRCEGSISGWKVVERRETGDLLELEVVVQVLPSNLREELMDSSFGGIDAEVLYEWVGKPRVVVALTEKIDGSESALDFGASALEEALLERNVRVFSGEQVESLIRREVALTAFEDPEKAAVLGQQLGAELVIGGRLLSSLDRTRIMTVGGERHEFVIYTSYLQLRGIRSATGEILFSKRWNNVDPGEADLSSQGKQSAMLRSLTHLVDTEGDSIVATIAEGWRKSVVDGETYALKIDGADGSRLSRIDGDLRRIPRVEEVQRRSFLGSTATYDVRYRGLQSAFEEALLEDMKSLELVRSEDRSLLVKFKAAAPRPAATTTLRIAAIDASGEVANLLKVWLESQAEIGRVEADPAKSGEFVAGISSEITTGELMARLETEGYLPLGISRNELEVVQASQVRKRP